MSNKRIASLGITNQRCGICNSVSNEEILTNPEELKPIHIPFYWDSKESISICGDCAQEINSTELELMWGVDDEDMESDNFVDVLELEEFDLEDL